MGKPEDATPLNRTIVAPVKLVPLMVTKVKAPPEVGLKLVMVGAPLLVTEKVSGENPVPPGGVTCQRELFAPGGTVVVICVALTTVKALERLPSRTSVAPVKLVPVSVTAVPAVPLAGAKEVIVGVLMWVKALAVVAVPIELVTAIVPEALAG